MSQSLVLHPFPEEAIGRHSSGQDDSFQFFMLGGLNCFFHEHLNDRLLEAGDDISNKLLRITLLRRGMAFHIIDHRRLDSTETEIERILPEEGSWESNGLRVSLFGEFVNQRTSRVPQ